MAKPTDMKGFSFFLKMILQGMKEQGQTSMKGEVKYDGQLYSIEIREV